MTEEPVFEITHNIYDPDMPLKLKYHLGSNITCNKYKLLNYTFHCDIQNFYFSAHIVNIWNSIPNTNYVVNVNTVNQFKACLDRF